MSPPRVWPPRRRVMIDGKSVDVVEQTITIVGTLSPRGARRIQRDLRRLRVVRKPKP